MAALRFQLKLFIFEEFLADPFLEFLCFLCLLLQRPLHFDRVFLVNLLKIGYRFPKKSKFGKIVIVFLKLFPIYRRNLLDFVVSFA